MNKQLNFLTCGNYAFLINRSVIAVGGNDKLIVTADVEEGTTFCIESAGCEPIRINMGESCTAEIPVSHVPEGNIHILFVKGETVLDGGELTVQRTDASGSMTILPALMASTLQREVFASMMAFILARLKAAEIELDELKNGADVIA